MMYVCYIRVLFCSVPAERLSHDAEAEGEKEPVVVISAGDDVTGTAGMSIFVGSLGC